MRPAPGTPDGWLVAQVTAATWENANTRSLTFRVAGWPGHRPGQHLDLRLTAENRYQAVRSYSVASALDGEQVTVTAERVVGGEVSAYLLDGVQVGDQLEVRGPLGGYFVWDADPDRPLVLIGGGSGVVPLLGMVRWRTALGPRPPVRLLYSLRSADDLISGPELSVLAGRQDGLELHLTYTRKPPPGWTGDHRRIDQNMLRALAWPVQTGAVAFICGPTAFVEQAATLLVNLGYGDDQIKTERFGPSGGPPA